MSRDQAKPAHRWDASCNSHRERPRLLDLMLLIGAFAFGLWLVLPTFRNIHQGNWKDTLFFVAVTLVGSVSAVGPLRIVRERLKNRRPVRAGRLVWLATGLSSWMLLPPVVIRRLVANNDGSGCALVCFVYAAPLIGLSLTLALKMCGLWRFRKSYPPPWRERFGRCLALAWSLLGVYVLYSIYRTEVVGGPLFNL